MKTLKVFDLLSKRALVTRESARVIGRALADIIPDDEGVALDFRGVEAVTPSFVDELLQLAEEAVAGRGRLEYRLLFLHPPTRLSSKFAAVGRARQVEIEEASDGAWVITASLTRHVG